MAIFCWRGVRAPFISLTHSWVRSTGQRVTSMMLRPTTVTAVSLTASGSLFDVSMRIATRTVPVAVAPNASATVYSSSIVPARLAGSGV